MPKAGCPPPGKFILQLMRKLSPVDRSVIIALVVGAVLTIPMSWEKMTERFVFD
jgi:hypothetical protein